MHPPSEATARYQDACEHYVIDSDPIDPSVKTREVLDAAVKYDAEVASLVDYVPWNVYEQELDPDDDPEAWAAYQSVRESYASNYDATVDSVRRGLEIAKSHAFDGTLLVPLQAPFVECWRAIGSPTKHWLGIGGLKTGGDRERLGASRELRDAVGDDVWVHGFGWGVRGLAPAIREEPGLLDSLDYSSPMQDAATDDCTPGEERMSVAAMGAAKRLVRDLREVSEYPDSAESVQVTL
jgi:hypothetical protein